MYRYLGHRLYVSDGEGEKAYINEGNVLEGSTAYIGNNKIELNLKDVSYLGDIVITLTPEQFSNNWEEHSASQVFKIKNLPYSPRDFAEDSRYHYMTHPSKTITIRVLPVNASTNWSKGLISKITRTYDYGLPATEKIPIVTKK